MVETQHQRHRRHHTPTHARQRAISRALGVSLAFDAASELDRRTAFLESILEKSGKAGYVLGISGGVDSLVAGRLAQLAVRRLRDCGRHAFFVAVRLPYGHQQDEQDAALAWTSLRPTIAFRSTLRWRSTHSAKPSAHPA
ncbi:NH(3)-dependent NAD(+) synthetase [Achromobacter kerstersii]|uniref:NH(3)-dependent NAD(+) synthetase n=1 Tax=Achromobacter kerstersii TaxID=1353890 RepID=A0A6S7C8H4_9BURK|nr:NH(3)-dependent NAD(+) synthetase [Achromobacter kerstersii]